MQARSPLVADAWCCFARLINWNLYGLCTRVEIQYHMTSYVLFSKRIALIGITNIAVSAISLLLIPILTKNLSVSDYGVWVQVNVTINVLVSVTTLGLPFAMVRFLAASKQRAEIREGFYSIATIVITANALVVLVLFFFSGAISALLFNSNFEVGRILPWLVLTAALNTVFMNYFRTFQQTKKFSILGLTTIFLSIFFVMLVIRLGYGLVGALFGFLFAQVVIASVMISAIIADIGIARPKLTDWRKYFDFGLPTIPGNVSNWAVNSSDSYVIGLLLGTSFVGYYSPGYALGGAVLVILGPLSILLPAALSKSFDEKLIDEVRTTLRYAMKYFLMLAIPAVFSLALLSKAILALISTPEIASNGYFITPFVALGYLFFGMYGIAAHVLVLEKKTKIIAMIWIIVSLLNVALNIILVPVIGILAAALTTLLAFAVAFVATTFYSRRYIVFDFEWRFVIKSVAASILISIIILVWHPVTFYSLVFTGAICICAYFVALVLLKGFTEQELKLFRALIK